MGIFSPDFGSVDAQIPIYEDGLYRVKVTKKTPFVKESKPDASGVVHESAGVRYALEMIGKFDEKGELITKDLMGRSVTPFSVFVHGEGGWKFSKGFLIAAGGYTLKDEQKANLEMFNGKADQWIFNGNKDTPTENIQHGPGYDIPLNKVLDVVLKKVIKKAEDGTDRMFENQEFKSWAPVK